MPKRSAVNAVPSSPPDSYAISLRGLLPRPSLAARVVVGVNGSAGSAAALQWAAAEAARRQVALRIVSAWQDDDPGEPDSALLDHPAQIAAARVHKALHGILRPYDRPRRISCATPQGVPGEVLVDEAEGACLLVLGATGQLPGPTSLYCLQRARGPLVFVPASPL
jgi:nucleotide-binding universal stress UspA family protein